MKGNAEPIVVEQTYRASPEKVWQAITDKDQMRQWFFETISDFTPELGFETHFNVRAEGRNYLHLWKVTEVVPKKRIVYRWRYGGVSGDSTVAWELRETANGTSLTLIHAGVETFSQEDPALRRESGEAGWNFFIRERLKSFLEQQKQG